MYKFCGCGIVIGVREHSSNITGCKPRADKSSLWERPSQFRIMFDLIRGKPKQQTYGWQ